MRAKRRADLLPQRQGTVKKTESLEEGCTACPAPQLLDTLGYRQAQGAYQHLEASSNLPRRFHRPWPKFRQVLEIARPMIEEQPRP